MYCVNRFGLLALWLAGVLVIHHFVAPGFFLDQFGWVVIFGVVLGGISGFCSYNAFKPEHHKNHSGAAVLVWSMGVLLLCVIAYLGTLLMYAADCLVYGVTGGSEGGSDQNAQAVAAPDWRLDPTIEGCGDVARTYAALKPFQTGIGATLGLLGLAWSTLYRSVYEDWVTTQAPAG